MKKFRKPKKFDECCCDWRRGGRTGFLYNFCRRARKVVLIEQGKMGGDCLNTGCIPSKTLIRASRLMSDISHAGEFGIEVGKER